MKNLTNPLIIVKLIWGVVLLLSDQVSVVQAFHLSKYNDGILQQSSSAQFLQSKSIMSSEDGRPFCATRLQMGRGDLEEWQRERLEAEIKDPVTFYEFLLPRPIRKFAWVAIGGNCFLGGLVLAARLAAGLSPSDPENIGQVAAQFGVAALMGLFFNLEQKGEQKRIERRKAIREVQMKRNDRTRPDAANPLGKLKPVDDQWMIRQLEKMNREDPSVPIIGEDKGAILQYLIKNNVASSEPVIVDVGGFLGYSAIKMAQALPSTGGKVYSIEKSLQYGLIEKRFVSQGKMDKKISVEIGDAKVMLKDLNVKQIDFLFLDADCTENMDYLQVALPKLQKGSIVVANGAGIYADTPGMKTFINFIKSNQSFFSYRIDCTTSNGSADRLEICFLSDK